MIYRILVTGATGNVGTETLRALDRLLSVNTATDTVEVYAGVRTLDDPRNTLPKRVRQVLFDFDRMDTMRDALTNMHALFLLRPPQIANVRKHFQPLIRLVAEKKIQHVVFLSVQGAEKSRFIPHHKIEKLIRESGVPYTFLRPGYFMQNLTTTLRDDIVKKGEIYLPAGKAKFNLVDAGDIGEVAARVLLFPDAHLNRAYDVTGSENLTFREMSEQLTTVLRRKVTYRSPNPISFVFRKWSEEVPVNFALVMAMLHFLPRFQRPPVIADTIHRITGRAHTTFREFAERNVGEWKVPENKPVSY